MHNANTLKSTCKQLKMQCEYQCKESNYNVKYWIGLNVFFL